MIELTSDSRSLKTRKKTFIDVQRNKSEKKVKDDEINIQK